MTERRNETHVIIIISITNEPIEFSNLGKFIVGSSVTLDYLFNLVVLNPSNTILHIIIYQEY